MTSCMKFAAFCLLVVLGLGPVIFDANAQTNTERLLAAYPEHLARIEDNILVWNDGTRMTIDDGRGEKSHAQWLADPDIKDMFTIAYPLGEPTKPPAVNSDPGRARNNAFFSKMYGDCRKGQVDANLVDVVWLPKKSGQRLRVTKVNGVAEKLTAVSRALDDLPTSFDIYLKPSEGTYICRSIAGTSQLSAHGYGIAIDIATKAAHYWRWSTAGTAAYQSKIPIEIVRIFENHGFIWGGKWWHYDTMHFEYRPELLTPTTAATAKP